MMGLFVTAILILVILIYVFKSILDDTDYQTWLNIALITIILLTVVLSIFMILNKASNTPKDKITPPAKQEQKAAETPATSSTPQQYVDPAEMSDDDLSVIIAENYLNLKNNYEAFNNGKDGSKYAADKIIEEYGLTQEEWDDFYKKAVEKGHLKKAEENLKKQNVDYLIKK